MSSKRQLKNKIRAVGNIRQITRAMEMVAATKMRKAQGVALRARPYAKHALSLLSRISQYAQEQQKSVFFENRKEGKDCLVVVTSDKGLCGSFNGAVLRIAHQWYLQHPGADVVAVGRKGRDFFKRREITPVAEFLQFSDVVTLHDVAPLSGWIIRAFEQGRYKQVTIAATQFFSALLQKPAVHQILPLRMQEIEDVVENIIPKTGKYSDLALQSSDGGATVQIPYVLEPTPEAILEALTRSLIQVEIMHFVFEANASEHSARMVAMKNATDNAEDLQEELQLLLNKARQGAITQELSEISAAKEALTS